MIRFMIGTEEKYRSRYTYFVQSLAIGSPNKNIEIDKADDCSYSGVLQILLGEMWGTLLLNIFDRKHTHI
jgi:hypothetical protein